MNPPLAEKLAQADAWARVLFEAIAAEDLQASFDRAFADHHSSFPVNAYDIKAAWSKIATERQQSEREARIRDNAANGIAAPNYKVCVICNDTGFAQERRCDERGVWHDGVIKSRGCCGYWDRRRAEIGVDRRL